MNPNYMNQLINDHAIIEKGLILLEKQIERKETMNVQTVQTLLEFLWDFGEQFHNQKEEQVYFPLLIKKGLPPQGPIGVMLTEHESERGYINKLKELAVEYAKTGTLPQEFIPAAIEYIELTKGHIWKENDILYPMGKNFIQADDEAFLLEEFEKLEKVSVGFGGTIRYQTLVNSLEKETEGRIDLLASLPTGIINNMLDVLPVELSFVDANDRVRYFNKLDKEKIFTRSLSVIGRTVQQCHPPKSVHMVNKILEEMKAGTRDEASFWIQMGGMFLHISYYAVRDNEKNYEGCIEMVQNIQPLRELEGQKTLLD